MSSDFLDHPRKRVVREKWNTPLLRSLSSQWKSKFVYCGLPGPKALDIVLWKEMIKQVIAFELECVDGTDIRRNVVALNRQLALLSIPSVVYVGPLEEVLLRGEDYDGQKLRFEELVTLYNLDFCNALTGSVTTKNGRQQLRFETLREICSVQRKLYRQCGVDRFVLFITVSNAFHKKPVLNRLRDRELPAATRVFLEEAGQIVPFNREQTLYSNTDVLKAFVFTCVRDSFHGQNIRPIFLPVVSYQGTTARSPMLHFAIVCCMGAQSTPFDEPLQSAEGFFKLATLTATDTSIKFTGAGIGGLRVEVDPSAYISRFM